MGWPCLSDRLRDSRLRARACNRGALLRTWQHCLAGDDYGLIRRVQRVQVAQVARLFDVAPAASRSNVAATLGADQSSAGLASAAAGACTAWAPVVLDLEVFERRGLVEVHDVSSRRRHERAPPRTRSQLSCHRRGPIMWADRQSGLWVSRTSNVCSTVQYSLSRVHSRRTLIK